MYVLMAYLFLLAVEIYLEITQSATQKLLKLIFHDCCQICMLKSGIPRKENNKTQIIETVLVGTHNSYAIGILERAFYDDFISTF